MNKVFIFVTGAFLAFQSCSEPEVFEITIPEGSNPYDSLFIQESITGETIAKIPLNSPQRKFFFPIEQPLLVDIHVKGKESLYLAILEPGSKRELVFEGENVRTKNQPADSLNCRDLLAFEFSLVKVIILAMRFQAAFFSKMRLSMINKVLD